MPRTYKLLSVIIPVYNEQATIAEVIEKVSAVEIPIAKEIIVVNDGSTDGTADILTTLSTKIHATHIATRNEGKGAAIRIGFGLAKGDIILIQDADLELDPNEYERLLEPILAGRCEVVYGSRFLQHNDVPVVRRFANRFLTWLTNVLFATRLTDMFTAYKVLSADVARSFVLTADRFDIEAEITAKVANRGHEIVEVPISYLPRTRLEGKKIKWYDGVRAIRMLVRCRLRRR